jgi:hypothetical protein
MIMDAEQTPVDETAKSTDVAADGYYGEDEMDDEELDLSFLDEEEADEEDGEAEPKQSK